MAEIDVIAQSLPKGFTKLQATSVTTHRLIVAVSGREKHGKTHFALTAPGPIAYQDLDIGTEGVIEKFVKSGKVIYHKEYGYTELKDRGVNNKEQFKPIWDKFKEDYIAIMDSKVRTVVMDTASEVWELLRMAAFGKLDHVMPHHYGPVNAEYRSLLRMAYVSNKNLILLHKVKPQYIDDKRTREYDRAGFGDTGFMVQVNMRCWRKMVDDSLTFGVTIDDSRQNADVAGMELTGDMCNFPMVASIITGVDVEKWT